MSQVGCDLMHSGANSETYMGSYVEGYVYNSKIESNRDLEIKSQIESWIWRIMTPLICLSS